MKNSRLEQIKEYIEKHGKATYDELAQLLPDVSNMTIRRDLSVLEEENVVIRVRNGAYSVAEIGKKTEVQFVQRFSYNVSEKKEIAEKTAKLIDFGGCIFIDSGSTTLYFARMLPDDKYCAVTNSINVATELLRKHSPEVVLLGGDVSRNNLVTIGLSTMNFLNEINIETAIMSTTGFSLEGGFSCGVQQEAVIKSAVIAKAKKVIMLLDSSKVNKNMPYIFTNLEHIDYLVVDKNFPKKLKEELESRDIKVI